MSPNKKRHFLIADDLKGMGVIDMASETKTGSRNGYIKIIKPFYDTLRSKIDHTDSDVKLM